MQAPAAAQRILTAVNRELGIRWQDSATRLLARLRPGAFSLQAGVDPSGQPNLTFQVTPTVAAQDALLVTEVLDAVEGELAARGLTDRLRTGRIRAEPNRTDAGQSESRLVEGR